MYSYHDTLNQRGAKLDAYESIAKSQDDVILEHFKANPYGKFTPFHIMMWFSYKKWPITSVRRAMSNLTKAGYLVKLNEKRKEEYGRDNFLWQLHPNYRPKNVQTTLF